MKLSTRARYGLKAMVDLALRYGEGPVALKAVAERQGISDNYLEQLMASLRKYGLVSSVRGAQGGYELSREPVQITVGDVIRALEGPIAPVDCVDESERDRRCQQIDTCVTYVVWKKLRDAIVTVLDAMTMEELASEARKRLAGTDPGMYYI